MNLSEFHRKLDIHEGCLTGQYDRLDDINNRMYLRNIPDHVQPPQFNMVSKPTRYVHAFPIIDPSVKSKVPIKNIDSRAVLHVDDESNLRKQGFALQHEAPQATYVPSSQSDLYRVEMPTYSRPHTSTNDFHPLLFQQQTYHTKTQRFIEEQQLNQMVFNNSTKTR